MSSFNKLQTSVLLTGFFGMTCVILSLAVVKLAFLGYLGNLMLRLSGALYATYLDRMRVLYLLPLTVSATNAIVNTPELLFVELLVSAGIYQFGAYQVFVKNKN